MSNLFFLNLILKFKSNNFLQRSSYRRLSRTLVPSRRSESSRIRDTHLLGEKDKQTDRQTDKRKTVRQTKRRKTEILFEKHTDKRIKRTKYLGRLTPKLVVQKDSCREINKLFSVKLTHRLNTKENTNTKADKLTVKRQINKKS